MFNPKPQVQHKPKEDGCEIEIKKTKSGKRIKFKGRCSRGQMQILANENGINIDND